MNKRREVRVRLLVPGGRTPVPPGLGPEPFSGVAIPWGSRSWPLGSARFLGVGLTALAPWDSIASTTARLWRPSSAMTTLAGDPSINAPARGMSDARPGVGISSAGGPRPRATPSHFWGCRRRGGGPG